MVCKREFFLLTENLTKSIIRAILDNKQKHVSYWENEDEIQKLKKKLQNTNIGKRLVF